ncbi:MAG: hypothetical protein EP321_14405 [Sphingomonadales bacterium]|nr:MAG: hypothetical protein EP345_09950 [Sphingomonadales bacterium]TNF02242.1 MAG: hypothetical protein EP321_14405 [Sphingomonadales bacterium]
MMRTMALIPALMATAMPASARDSLGVFEGWGAFRDAAGPRCYAIAEPVRSSPGKGDRRAFAAIGTWPEKHVRAQFHVRLSRARAEGSALYLSIGDRRFALLASAGAGWAQDARMDAAIIAAMRTTRTMSVEGKAGNGRAFYDLYVLRGAATAIDAAALGCIEG